MMNILSRYRPIFLIFLVFLVCSECFPSKHRKPGNPHKRTTRSHLKGHGHHGKSTKKDSVRPSRQEVMAAVMHPGKLDMREEKELSQLQDFNKAYINNEMAAETSLLANQGIDDDSALRISNIEALPGALRGAAYASSTPKTKFNDMKEDTTSMSKQNVAGFNPDEYMLDANSWPEYKIKDSDYMNRNFRVFPQGSNEGEGGFQGNMVPYGARGRMEEGMEGPYGDGNYGFPAPPQMVSDQPSPPQVPEEGTQTSPMPMSDANKVQRLVMKHNKHKHPAGETFNDLPAGSSKGLLHSAEGGSGSGEGSGSIDPNVKGTKAPSSPKGASDTPKAANMKSQGKVGGKVEVGADLGGKGAAGPSAGGGGGGGGGGAGGAEGGSGDTAGAVGAGKTGSDGTGGTEAAATETKANSEGFQILSSQPKQESTASSTKTPKPEKVKQDSDKTQNPNTIGKSDSMSEKTGSNASNGNASNYNMSSGSSAKEITNALSQAQGNTPLGQFAEFLKAKGITLAINKDKATTNSNSNDAPATPDKSRQPSSSSAQSAPPPESMLASVLPTTGESLAQTSSDANTNTITKTNGSQDSQAGGSNNLDNAIMNWQNIAPQNAGPIGQLFLRQSTKQGHN